MLKHFTKTLKRIFKKQQMSFKPLPWEEKKHNNATLKIFKPTLDYIEEISEGGKSSITLEIEKLDGTIDTQQYFSLLKKRKEGIPFTIHIPKLIQNIGSVAYKETYGLAKRLSLKKNGKQYIVNKGSVFDFKTVYPREPQILEGKFLSLQSDFDENTKNYHRLVLPTDDLDIINSTAILLREENHMKFDLPKWDTQETDLGIRFMTTLGMFSRLIINDREFHFYYISDIKSIIIDCVDKISFKEFKNQTKAILLCFGFISGKLYGGEKFYLSSVSNDFSTIDNFYYKVEEKSILTDKRIINLRMFSTQYEKLGEDKKAIWKQYHKPFPTDVFSKLCENILESSEIKRSIELIVNAGKINDPIQKGALYSVSVETITAYLYEKDKEKFNPIKDKVIWKEFREKLNSLLDEYTDKITKEGIDILKAKFSSLNSPTNRDKLTKPFNVYGIELSKEDVNILDQRNKYLHGDEPDKTQWKFEQELIALKLHTIISSLILKHSGYSGYLINLAGWYVLSDSDIKSIMEILDFEELGAVLKKINEKDFDTMEQINNARKIVENFDKFTRAAYEIENLIRIID